MTVGCMLGLDGLDVLRRPLREGGGGGGGAYVAWPPPPNPLPQGEGEHICAACLHSPDSVHHLHNPLSHTFDP